MMATVTQIGHNRAPFDDISDTVESLYEEAGNWLDGEVAKTEGQADALTKLLTMLRAAEKDRLAAFTEEKKPHLEAGRAADAKWNPLKKRLARAIAGCQAALTPWRNEQNRIKQEAADKARLEAEEQRREAEAALRATSLADLAGREEAEEKLEVAKKGAAKAKRIEKAPTGLRTSYVPVLTDLMEAIKHYWSRDRDRFQDLVEELARKDVYAGKREIPGFTVEERKVAR